MTLVVFANCMGRKSEHLIIAYVSRIKFVGSIFFFQIGFVNYFYLIESDYKVNFNII